MEAKQQGSRKARKHRSTEAVERRSKEARRQESMKAMKPGSKEARTPRTEARKHFVCLVSTPARGATQ